MKQVAKRIDSYTHLYRGKTITVNKDIKPGKNGRYIVNGFLLRFSNLRIAKEAIDAVCKQKNIESF